MTAEGRQVAAVEELVERMEAELVVLMVVGMAAVKVAVMEVEWLVVGAMEEVKWGTAVMDREEMEMAMVMVAVAEVAEMEPCASGAAAEEVASAALTRLEAGEEVWAVRALQQSPAQPSPRP